MGRHVWTIDECMNGERLEDSSSDLVRQAQRAGGTTEAFAALVERFEKTALAVAYAACGDANQAADVVQEAFLRAWQRLRELQDERKFGPWLCTIVRNIATDSRRRCAVATCSASSSTPKRARATACGSSRHACGR